MIEVNPSITIKKLNEEYRATFPNLERVHNSTLSKSIEGKYFVIISTGFTVELKLGKIACF